MYNIVERLDLLRPDPHVFQYELANIVSGCDTETRERLFDWMLAIAISDEDQDTALSVVKCGRVDLDENTLRDIARHGWLEILETLKSRGLQAPAHEDFLTRSELAHPECLQLLLDCGAKFGKLPAFRLDVDYPCEESMLTSAVKYGFFESAHVLLNAGISPRGFEDSEKFGETPLKQVIWQRHRSFSTSEPSAEEEVKLAKRLIELGVPLDSDSVESPRHAWTVLGDAISNKKYHLAKLLIQEGANVNFRTETGRTILDEAIESELYFEDQDFFKAILFASDLEHVFQLLELDFFFGASIDVINYIFNEFPQLVVHPNFKFALHAAATQDQEHSIPFLINHGADPGMKNQDGFIPYEIAIQHRNMNVAKSLLNFMSMME